MPAAVATVVERNAHSLVNAPTSFLTLDSPVRVLATSRQLACKLCKRLPYASADFSSRLTSQRKSCFEASTRLDFVLGRQNTDIHGTLDADPNLRCLGVRANLKVHAVSTDSDRVGFLVTNSLVSRHRDDEL